MFFHIGKAGKTVQEMKSKYEVEINTTRRSETPFGLDERAISIEGFCAFVTLLRFKKQIKQFCYSRLLYTVNTSIAMRRNASPRRHDDFGSVYILETSIIQTTVSFFAFQFFARSKFVFVAK